MSFPEDPSLPGLRGALARVLEPRRKALLDFASDLIRIPTENPPGRRYREGADRIAAELDRLGIAHEIVDADSVFRHALIYALAAARILA
jgi:acetylornithine deacetylase/succinyl-diaminopimelate desuccinylase-like protein